MRAVFIVILACALATVVHARRVESPDRAVSFEVPDTLNEVPVIRAFEPGVIAYFVGKGLRLKVFFATAEYGEPDLPDTSRHEFGEGSVDTTARPGEGKVVDLDVLLWKSLKVRRVVAENRRGELSLLVLMPVTGRGVSIEIAGRAERRAEALALSEELVKSFEAKPSRAPKSDRIEQALVVDETAPPEKDPTQPLMLALLVIIALLASLAVGAGLRLSARPKSVEAALAKVAEQISKVAGSGEQASSSPPAKQKDLEEEKPAPEPKRSRVQVSALASDEDAPKCRQCGAAVRQTAKRCMNCGAETGF